MNSSKLELLSLRNVRSYPNQDICFSPGLNVIVGESDSGKTNIVRSLRTLVENGSLDSIRTSGLSKVRAEIHLRDLHGYTFSLLRSEAVNTVCFNGGPRDVDLGDGSVTQADDNREWTSVGNATPDEFKNLLGLSPIDLSGVEADVHFSDQRDPLFVVDDPPSKVAKIVGAVSGLDVLYRAVAAGDRSRRDASADVRSCEKVRDSVAAEHKLAKERADLLRPLAEAVANANTALVEANGKAVYASAARERYVKGQARAKLLREASLSLNESLSRVRGLTESAAVLLNARDRYLRAASDFTAAKESNNAAQANAAQARASFDQTARDLAGSLVPCPTCGTSVRADILACGHV